MEIENIIPSVHTINNRRIVALTKTIATTKTLICFEKDSIGPNMPNTRTVMTGCHQLYHRGKLSPARVFLNNRSIHKVSNSGEPLYNILMERYEVMRVNNLAVETLHPGHYIAQKYLNEL